MREKYEIESFSFDSLDGNEQDGYLRVKQTNDAYAVFGAVGYSVTPDLRLHGGLRYTRDGKTFAVQDYGNVGVLPCVVLRKCNIGQLRAQGPVGA